ncbi:MAG: hypothetical protein LBU92_02170 [Prevotellaceae bacterium]|jgi:hypothetical protein|nr:hypothetical protein [Prevotellaceae bacterium]
MYKIYKNGIAMKKYLFAALLAGLSLAAFAQAKDAVENSENPRIGFALQPQTLLYNGLRIDIQPYLKPSHQLVIAPQLYYFNGDASNFSLYDNGNDISDMKGLGLELNYRIFPKEGKPLYWALGINYNFFQAGYLATTFYNTDENGLPTYEYGSVNNQQNINRVGASAVMGWQIPTLYGFFFDLYWGVGFRYSFVNKRYDDDISFDGGMWSMARRGNYLVLGAKIGFEL